MDYNSVFLRTLGILFVCSLSYTIYWLTFGVEKLPHQIERWYYSSIPEFGRVVHYIAPQDTGAIEIKPYKKKFKVYVDERSRAIVTKQQIDYCTGNVWEKFVSCTLFYAGCVDRRGKHKKNFDECMQPLKDI